MYSTNLIKSISIVSILIATGLVGQQVSAKVTNCAVKQQHYFDQMICKDDNLKTLQSDVHEKYLATQLMSNAPLSLVQHSQHAWDKFTRLCKSKACIQRQLEQRLDDLTLMTNLNQSLTQHYIRYRDGRNTQQMTTLQLHQMDKNRIKIEGMQYRNPNNSENARIAYLRSYTSTALDEKIIDLETRCTYQLVRSKYSLAFSSDDQKCQRFVGIYKLYD